MPRHPEAIPGAPRAFLVARQLLGILSLLETSFCPAAGRKRRPVGRPIKRTLRRPERVRWRRWRRREQQQQQQQQQQRRRRQQQQNRGKVQKSGRRQQQQQKQQQQRQRVGVTRKGGGTTHRTRGQQTVDGKGEGEGKRGREESALENGTLANAKYYRNSLFTYIVGISNWVCSVNDGSYIYNILVSTTSLYRIRHVHTNTLV